MSWRTVPHLTCPRCLNTEMHRAFGSSTPATGWTRACCPACGYIVLTPNQTRRDDAEHPKPGEQLETGKG